MDICLLSEESLTFYESKFILENNLHLPKSLLDAGFEITSLVDDLRGHRLTQIRGQFTDLLVELVLLGWIICQTEELTTHGGSRLCKEKQRNEIKTS